LPKLIEKGYVAKSGDSDDYVVDMNFTKVDDEFRGWFHERAEMQIDKIQQILEDAMKSGNLKEKDLQRDGLPYSKLLEKLVEKRIYCKI